MNSVYETTTYLAFIMPIILFALSVILTLCLRWFTYREKMAMIERGIPPQTDAADEAKKNKKRLAYGVTTALIGVALTLGLITLGIGPWLLVGLIPLFVGLSIILSYLIMQPPKPEKEPSKKPEQASPQPALEEPDSEEIETDMDEPVHDYDEYGDDPEKRAL